MEYKIKFSNIRDLADARFAASVQAEWISFSAGFATDLPLNNIQEIVKWVSGPTICLDLHPTITKEVLESLLVVLPIKAVTLLKEQLHIVSNLNTPLQTIVTNGEHALTQIPNLIQANNILPLQTLDPNFILDNNIQLFELTCYNADPLLSVGEKDFTNWASFFEKLELL